VSKLKSNYTILLNHNLVIEFHSGILTALNYIEFKKKLLNDSLFKADLNHLIDFKNVKFNTNPTDISDFVDFLKSRTQFLGNRKVAFVTNTPNQVVSTTIYKLTQGNLNQEVEIFSTEENALKWLNIPNSVIKDVLKIINKLK
jgi:hypothetical protein